MKEKKPIYKLLTLAVMLMAILSIFLSGCKPQETAVKDTPVSSTAVAETTLVKTQSTEQLSSEQPDKAKYDEYFVEFYLCKAPRGQQIPQIHPGSPGITKTSVFIASEDEFCVTGTIKKK